MVRRLMRRAALRNFDVGIPAVFWCLDRQALIISIEQAMAKHPGVDLKLVSSGRALDDDLRRCLLR